MRKALDFPTYKRLQKFSLNDANRWVTTLYVQAYNDGKDEIKNECAAILTEERLMEILLSVKGIGKNRANQVIEKILKEGIDYGNET